MNDTVAVDKAVLTKLFAKSILIGSFPVLKVDIDVDSKTSKYILQVGMLFLFLFIFYPVS